MLSFFEWVLRLNGFDPIKAQKQLQCFQGKNLERRDEIVEYHMRHNAFYKRMISERNIERFEDLPVLTKKDFQKPLSELISEGFKMSDLYISNTSGSSGHPFFFAKDKSSHAITHAVILNEYGKQGVTPDLLQARFYGIPLSGWSSCKERIKDFLSHRIRLHVFDLSDRQLEKYLQVFMSKKFGYVYGYTSAIVQFAKFLNRKQVVLNVVCPSLIRCIVTSEMCTSEDQDIIQKSFGVPVIKEYGCSETGLIAFDTPEIGWRMITEDTYFEVVDQNNQPLPYGAEGKLLLTSLSNKAMPIIRYEIGDMGVLDKVGGQLVLKQLSGRVSDMVKTPSGKTAAGLTFYYISRSMLEQNASIREFIVRQTALDTFEFDVVSDEELSLSEIHFLQEKLDEYLEPGLKLIIHRVDRIERPSSGKIKHFYSQI